MNWVWPAGNKENSCWKLLFKEGRTKEGIGGGTGGRERKKKKEAGEGGSENRKVGKNGRRRNRTKGGMKGQKKKVT